MKSRKSFDKDITSYILELLWAFKLVIIFKLSYLKTRYSGYRNTEFFNSEILVVGYWDLGYHKTYEFFGWIVLVFNVSSSNIK